MMAVFSFFSAVRGHHVYQSTWKPIIGEQLQVDREVGNPFAILHAQLACFHDEVDNFNLGIKSEGSL